VSAGIVLADQRQEEVIHLTRSHHARRWLIGSALTATLALTVTSCGGTSTAQSSQVANERGNVRQLDGGAKPRRQATQASTRARPAPIVHLPPRWSATERLPLVIALHASGGDPEGFEEKSGWDTVADEHNFIVGYLGSAAPAWKDPSNVAYIGSQIDSITAKYHVDPNRVYVTGFSAGAYISYFVGCRLSAKVAAIAPVSGGMLSQHCKLARPVSELTIMGTHDILPLSGTAKFAAPAAVTALWRGLDHCSRKLPTMSVVGPVTQRTWGSCAGGTAVGLYILQGGRHVYPGAAGLPPAAPDARYDASEAVWSFFAAHRSRG
jgi:polyhydroxybutyrate depolymerase